MDWTQIAIALIAAVVGWLGRHMTTPAQPTKPAPIPAPIPGKTPILDALRSFLADEGSIAEQEALALLHQLVKPTARPTPAGSSTIGA